MRTVANSRVRWAIVIESEFAITKAPTKSAIPPKARRKPRRNEMKLFVSAASSRACWDAVFTCAVGGSSAVRSRTSSSSETPGFAATAISSSRPRFPKSSWAVGRSKPASVAPPIVETDPNRTRPEIRSRCAGPSAWTPIDSPSRKSSLSAVDSSTTSSPAFGQAPSTSVSGLKGESPALTLKPRFGAPP